MADDLYQRDIVAWAEAQAAALRRRSANEIDWDNVAEEVGDVGGNVVRACESQVINILVHFLKIEFSGLNEPLDHWAGEIGAFRIELERDLTPTIAARMPDRLNALYRYAVRSVHNDARKRSETAFTMPDACPYSWEDVLGRGGDWMPAPREA
jgi:hypothetical protein